MKELTDQEMIELIRDRLETHRRARNDLLAVTEKLELMNRKLRESEALKSHFLSNIRNEINNPLTAIMGLSRQLFARGGPAALSAPAGEMIYFEAFNLDFQLRNIFAAAELEAGETTPACARVDVAGLVGGAVDSVSHLAARKRLALRIEAPSSLCFVTDARMVDLMLLNLLMNAVEYSPEGGEVMVAASSTAGELRLSVRDFGIGIEAEFQEIVFDRFRQLESGACKSHPGHGLGLSVSKALIELLGGSIALESGAGKGSRFTLAIPEGSLQSEVLAQEGNFFLFDAPERF